MGTLIEFQAQLFLVCLYTLHLKLHRMYHLSNIYRGYSFIKGVLKAEVQRVMNKAPTKMRQLFWAGLYCIGLAIPILTRHPHSMSDSGAN